MKSIFLLYTFSVILVAIIYFPERTYSAPAKTSDQNQTFSRDLLKYTSEHKCLFPIQSDFESNIDLFKKVDYVCQNNTSAISGSLAGPSSAPLSPLSANPIDSLCVGVAQIVEKICQLNLTAADFKDNNLSLDEDITDQKTTNTKVFCENVVNYGPKTADLRENIQGFYDNFILKNKQEEENSHCSSVCKNKPVAGIKGDEKFIINPICLMFKKGYEVWYEASKLLVKSDGSSNTKEVVPDLVEIQNTDQIKPKVKKDDSEKSLIGVPQDNSEGLVQSSTSVVNKIKTKPKVETEDPTANKAVSNNAEDKTSEANGADTKKSQSESSSPSSIGKQMSSSNAPMDTVSGQPKPTSQPAVVAAEDKEKQKPNVNNNKSSTTTTTPSSDDPMASELDGELPQPPLDALDLKSSSPKTKTENNQPVVVISSTSKNPVVSAEKAKVSKPSDADVDEATGAEEDEYADGSNGIPPPSNPDDDTNPENKVSGDKAMDSNEEKVPNNEDSPLGRSDKLKKKTNTNRLPPSKFPTDNDEVGTLKFDKDRTVNINVYNEDENGGFFNYFLFFVTFLGLCFLIFHNKRRLLAYVVEGRKPRGSRTRRRSSSSGPSYRKLENNFE